MLKNSSHDYRVIVLLDFLPVATRFLLKFQIPDNYHFYPLKLGSGYAMDHLFVLDQLNFFLINQFNTPLKPQLASWSILLKKEILFAGIHFIPEFENHMILVSLSVFAALI